MRSPIWNSLLSSCLMRRHFRKVKNPTNVIIHKNADFARLSGGGYMQKIPLSTTEGFFSSELLHFGGLAGGGAVGRNGVDQRVLAGLVLGLLAEAAGAGVGLQQGADRQGDLLVLRVDVGDLRVDLMRPRRSTSPGLPMRRSAIWEMWIRPSAPGSTSAKAPKGISLTILTFAMSPTE